VQKTSTKGKAALVCREGLVTGAYKDSVGVWTIGVGHTKHAGAPHPKAGMTLSVKKALDLFEKDLEKYEAGVRKAFGNKEVPQEVFDAAVSFHYNTGAINRASWVKDFNKRGKATKTTASLMLRWKKPPEVLGRRKEEANQLLGKHFNYTRAMLYPATKSGKVLWSKGKPFNPLDFFAEKEIKQAHKVSTAVKKVGAPAAATGLLAAVYLFWDKISELFLWLTSFVAN